MTAVEGWNQVTNQAELVVLHEFPPDVVAVGRRRAVDDADAHRRDLRRFNRPAHPFGRLFDDEPGDYVLTDLTLSGEGGNSYALTSASSIVGAPTPTGLTIQLSGQDLIQVAALLDQAGSSSLDGHSYSLTANAGWDTTAATTETVTPTATNVDSGPTANPGAVTVGHSQTSVDLTSLINSLFTAGAAGDGTAITSVTGGASLVGGEVLYTPPASGGPNFNYTVADSLGQSATNSVDVTVDPGPTVTSTPPTFVAAGGTPVVGSASPGLPGDALTLITSGGGDLAPTYGALSLTNGQIIYDAPRSVPAGGEKDTFTYQIEDEYGDLSAPATDTLTLDAGPVANSGAVTVGHSQTSVNLTSLIDSLFTAGAAGDGTAITSVTGGASLVGGEVLYTPPASGGRNFNYTVADSLGQSATNSVDVTVDPGPTAGAISSLVDFGASVNLTSAILAAAKAGLNGDTLTITADNLTGAAGQVSLVNGQLTYTATGAGLDHIPANGSESDTFAFTVSDQYGDTSTAAATVKVENPADVINGPWFGFGKIEGTAGADIINAYGWFNTIYDNGGNDVVNAGRGNANVHADGGDVVVNLDGYYDTVSGGNGWDTVSGSDGAATITLGDGVDNVSTDGFWNSITLGNGNDTVNAGLGDATVKVGNGAAAITIGGYFNTVTAGNGNDKVVAATLNGGDGNDTVKLGGGADTVNLGGFSNFITVGNGADVITAGAGSDKVVTGSGADAVTLAGWNNTVTLGGGVDTVTGGQGRDIITERGGSATLNLSGRGEQVFLDNGANLIARIGASNATVSISGFGADPLGVIDLLNGAGGFKSVGAILSSLHSDGRGGTLLSLSPTGSIDIEGVAKSSLHASNFAIG